MPPAIYDLFLVALSAFLSWLITHKYYLKSLTIQNNELQKEIRVLTSEIRKNNELNPIVAIQDHIEKATEEWRRRGTAKFYLDSIPDLTNKQKAEIFLAASLRKKGRPPKNNPYIQ